MDIRKRYWLLFLIGIAASLAFFLTGDSKAEKDTSAKPTALEMGKITPPIGKPRSDKEYSKDISDLLFDRRVSSSDLPGGIAFNPKECMRCHENEPGVEGQIFYGNPDFKKDVDWPKYLGDAEKKMAPSLKYDFVETHRRKSELVKGHKEQVMKQNQ